MDNSTNDSDCTKPNCPICAEHAADEKREYDQKAVAAKFAPQWTAMAAIIEERARQQDCEGYSNEHDDEHKNGELSMAAAAYAIHAIAGQSTAGYRYKEPMPFWPWGIEAWKPKNPRYDLIRAGALILAELERMERQKRNNEDSHVQRS